MFSSAHTRHPRPSASPPPHRLFLHRRSGALESTAHLEFYLRWTETLLTLHGAHLLRTYGEHMTAFRALQKALARQHTDLARLCHENQYQLDYLASFAHHDADEQAAAAAAADGSAEPQVEFIQKQTPAWAVASSSSSSSSAVAASKAAVFADDDDDEEEEDSGKTAAVAAAAAATAATRKPAAAKPPAAAVAVAASASASAGAKKKQKAV